VRHFISDLAGLRRPDKQKLVLAETGTANTTLAAFFDRGRPAIAAPFSACRVYSKAPPPEALGVIGKDHLRADFVGYGAAPETLVPVQKLSNRPLIELNVG
jgi:hypothetical protein